jgi:Zn-dependent peptidase ImmA (M78 family)
MIVTKKKKAIETLANSLIDVLNLSFPIPIEEVPAMLEGRIIFEPFHDENLEALIRKDGNSFEIQVSPDRSPLRQRFSIAHEIGHLFLHMGYLINPELWDAVGDYRDSVYYRLGHNSEEYEANEFAAAFLMPENEFKKIARENLVSGMYDIEKISRYFGVSEMAVTTRGKWLGLFVWE